MIYQNAQLHNIAEAGEVPGSDAVRLQRVPERVRMKLEEPAQLPGRQLVAHDVEKLQFGESRSFVGRLDIGGADRVLRQIPEKGDNRRVANDHAHLFGVVCQ